MNLNPYTQLAKQAVENYIKNRNALPLPEDLPDEMLSKKAGVFVTLRKNGALRGCIGTPLPTRANVAEEIIQNAIAAATEDYRFGPVTAEELTGISYEVSVLSFPEQVKDVRTLNPKKYGILIKTIEPPFKAGLLLPDIEGIDTSEKQIALTCQKGGIDPKQEGILIYRFGVEKHK